MTCVKFLKPIYQFRKSLFLGNKGSVSFKFNFFGTTKTIFLDFFSLACFRNNRKNAVFSIKHRFTAFAKGQERAKHFLDILFWSKLKLYLYSSVLIFFSTFRSTKIKLTHVRVSNSFLNRLWLYKTIQSYIFDTVIFYRLLYSTRKFLNRDKLSLA